MSGKKSQLSNANSITKRPITADHVDVHVFVLPRKDWRNELNLAFNEAVSSAISLGFLRVNKSISLVDLRSLINKECSEPLPNEFAFIKSVGRAFAIVKENQELELKIKHFISPNAYSSEVFLIDWPKDGKEELIDNDEQARLKQRQEELERLRRQMEINEAAVKIQSTYRGYRDRQRVMAMESVLTDEQLQDKLDKTRQKRLELENMREELIKYLKQLHNKITLARKEARVVWKKKYFAEKKKNPRDKESIKTNMILKENWQERQYQQFMTNRLGPGEDTQSREKQLSYLKLHDQLFLYNRQLEQAKIKLAIDIKLRNQAESERTSLRRELVNTRININQLKKIVV